MDLSQKSALIYQEHDVISQLQEIAMGKKVSFYNNLTGSIKYDRITSVCMVIRYIIKIMLFPSSDDSTTAPCEDALVANGYRVFEQW